MGASGGGSSGSSSTKPWKAQKPYLEGIYREAGQLYGAGPTDLEQAATGAQAMRAMEGSPLIDSAQGLADYTLRGGFLHSNPYLDATFQQAADRVGSNYMRNVLPTVETRFGGTGRRGSGAYMNALRASAEGLGDALGRLGTNIYGDNYQRERGRQIATMQQARPLAREDYYDIAQLRDAGLDPWNRLMRFSGAIGAPVMKSSSDQRSFNMGFGLL